MILETIKQLNRSFIIEYSSFTHSELIEDELTQFTYSQIQYAPKFAQIGLAIATVLFSIMGIFFGRKLFYNASIENQKQFLEKIRIKQWEPFTSMLKFYKSVFLLYFYFKTEPN